MNGVLRPLGIRIVRIDRGRYARYRPFMDCEDPCDIEDEFWELFDLARPFSMVTAERFYALYLATKYVIANRIEGAFVETGVWRGGSSLFPARMLANAKLTDRDVYLYDTFEGMPPPSDKDVDAFTGRQASETYARHRTREGGIGSDWLCASLEDVRRTMALSGYPADRIHYVRGKVEETLPTTTPDRVALMRLDTDWYASTRAEFEHLYPKLSPGGVVLLDDYGYWEGSRCATDEYLERFDFKPLIQRVDSFGRMFTKPF